MERHCSTPYCRDVGKTWQLELNNVLIRIRLPCKFRECGKHHPRMVALCISGEKRAKPASSVLVPRRACPATFSIGTFICRYNEDIASVAWADANTSGAGTS
ncbi:hypothetical protein LIER_02631 [Lithospermum erythrorhizon]|uniref:Uncharacterized protein n=1 Tax=Lithospermum erythrorhizon TaxID=34254 RepID=A0AAV3NQK6_LITER